jgi:hypothetical protein
MKNKVPKPFGHNLKVVKNAKEKSSKENILKKVALNLTMIAQLDN